MNTEPDPRHNKLRFSDRQKLFWLEAAERLYRARKALEYIAHFGPKRDAALKAALKSGVFPEPARPTVNPKPANPFPTEYVREYREPVESLRSAWMTIYQQGHGKPKTKVVDPQKDRVLAAREFTIDYAGEHKSIAGLHRIILGAAKDNDVLFFKKLGRALSSKKRNYLMNWGRCDPIDLFLVKLWCGPDTATPEFPPLCFMTGETLAEFCGHALEADTVDLGTERGKKYSTDAIQKRTQRLGLKHANKPRIGRFIFRDNAILLEA